MQYYNIEEIKKNNAPKRRIPIIVTIISVALSVSLFVVGVLGTTASVVRATDAAESALLKEGSKSAHDINLGNTLRISTVNKVSQKESIPTYTKAQLRKLDVSKPSGVTVSDLKLVTKGNFVGLEEAFWQAEQDYNINCLFLMAIGANESAYGTICFRKNNMFGFGGKGYATKADNIDAVAKTLANKYLRTGASLYHGKTVDAVHTSYASSSVWDDHVINYMHKFYNTISPKHNAAINKLK